MAACPRCGSEFEPGAKFCSECGLDLAAGASTATSPARKAAEPERLRPRTRRKTVTVVFTDLVGSTAMGESVDPEIVRSVMARYFSQMQAILERHGAIVEKFIGDAIMAVFGLDQVHEDDAERAVRAADEMRRGLAELNEELLTKLQLTIATRTGINTGEVVAGEISDGQLLATGDTVNTAARLEQAAAAGEILLGAATWQLVRRVASADPVEPIQAKGKAEPLSAVRLTSVATPGSEPEATPRTMLLGRNEELHELQEAFDRAVGDRRALLVTVSGDAGVGKSSIVNEFVGALGPSATVLRGRCLPYGDGITYWPLRQLLHQAADISEADGPATAMDRLRLLVAGQADAEVLAARLGSAIGLLDEPTSTNEINWAVRRTLEGLGADRPLVVVVEDIHWAQPGMLELIEHVWDAARNVPLLLICLTRGDLQDTRPEWFEPSARRVVLSLGGLPSAVADRLADSVAGGFALDPELRQRIVATAEGNPLFVEEMVRVAREAASSSAGRASVSVPLTIQAVMAARIDGLPDEQRMVAQRGSVVGRTFEEPAVVSMSVEVTPDDVARSLQALVRKEVMAPNPPELTGAPAYKFRHILLQDAAYRGLPKLERADLHEQVAAWLEGVAGNRIAEYREIVGYHLEEAYRYRTQLREQSERTASIATRAAAHLASAGKRAEDRGDSRAAVELLTRAVALPGSNDATLADLRVQLAISLLETGQVAGARDEAEKALETASAAGDAGLRALARLARLDVSLADGSLIDADPVAAQEVLLAMEDAVAAGSARALALAWLARSGQAYMGGRWSENLDALDRALEFARECGDAALVSRMETDKLTMALVGSTPVRQVLTMAESVLATTSDHPSFRADVLRLMAVAEALDGRHAEARTHAEEAVHRFTDLGMKQIAVNALGDKGWVHMLAGDLAEAELAFRNAHALAHESDDRTGRSWTAGRMAQFLKDVGRLDDAKPFLDEAEDVPIIMNRTRALGGRLRLLAIEAGRSGQEPERNRAHAELARLIESLGDVASNWNITIDGWVDAAEAAASLGEHDAAREYAQAAMQVALRKGARARATQIEKIIKRVSAPG